MPFSHNGLKTTTGRQVFSQVNKYTLSYRFLYGNVQGCVFAKNRPVSLNWTDYTIADTIIHGHGTRVSFKNHTRLSRIHSKATVGSIVCKVYTDGQPYKPCVLCQTGFTHSRKT